MKFFISLLLLMNTSLLNAKIHVKTDKHFGGRFLKKIISLSEDKINDSILRPSNPKDGYLIEVERTIEGFGGPIFEKDLFQKNVSVGIGVDFTSGLTFLSSKKVKTLVEADHYSLQNPINFMKAEYALKMTNGEKAQLNFFAGIVFAPEVKNIGIWSVATGGWNVEVEKKEGTFVSIRIALIDSKSASFFFDKFDVMLSYDVGKELENGFEIDLDLSNKEAMIAYERLFRGNIKYSQEESLKNKKIVFRKNTAGSNKYKGIGIWARSPMIAWFLLNSTHHLNESEKIEYSYEDKKHEMLISSSYEEMSELDLLGKFIGRERSFRVSYSLENHKFEMRDVYELEENDANKISLMLSSMNEKTMMDEYFKLNFSDRENKFFHAGLEVIYAEEFLDHILNRKLDLDSINALARKKLNTYYFDKLKYYKYSDPTSILQQKFYDEQNLNLSILRIQKEADRMIESFEKKDIKGMIEHYAVLMKYVYRSPSLYKAFVEYSKKCGTEIKYKIENEAFAKKEKIQKFSSVNCK